MATATATPKVPMIRLRHPEFAGLQFGPDAESAIVFGNRAGQAEFEAWIPEDHPLLEALLQAHPEVQIVRESGPAIMWACPFHPDSVFKTKNALIAHMKGKGHAIEDLATLAPAPAEEDAPGVHHSRDGVVMQDPAVPPLSARPGFGG